MPFASAVSPFSGDAGVNEFIHEVWLPFARDQAGWVDNQAPSPGVAPADTEVWTHRGGTSASNEQPPFIFMRATGTDILSLFTGTGVDLGEQLYDQPGNPCNGPRNSGFSDILTSPQRQYHQFITALSPGTGYESYWLFAPEDGSYIHCCLKVADRHYRHFWVGLLEPIVSGLDPESFYVCGHYWDDLDCEMSSIDPADAHVFPYSPNHRPPHGTYGGSNQLDSQKYQQASQFYMPNIRAGIDWFCADTSSAGTLSLSKAVGNVNTSLTAGVAQVAGYKETLGAGLYACDDSFTAGTVPLVPILVFGSFSFDGAERIGPLARIPDVFRINMQNFTPEQEILVGSETYVVLPLINVDSANWQAGEPYSGFEGLAYRKVGS